MWNDKYSSTLFNVCEGESQKSRKQKLLYKVYNMSECRNSWWTETSQIGSILVLCRQKCPWHVTDNHGPHCFLLHEIFKGIELTAAWQTLKLLAIGNSCSYHGTIEISNNKLTGLPSKVWQYNILINILLLLPIRICLSFLLQASHQWPAKSWL